MSAKEGSLIRQLAYAEGYLNGGREGVARFAQGLGVEERSQAWLKGCELAVEALQKQYDEVNLKAEINLEPDQQEDGGEESSQVSGAPRTTRRTPRGEAAAGE